MLRAIGYRSDLHLKDGDWRKPPGPMLYDPSGRAWPSCSLLFASFTKGGLERDPPSDAVDFYGRRYEVHRGTISMPTRDLGAWRKIGPVEELEYTRPGTKAPGDFGHLFGKRRWQTLYKASCFPVLYVLGRAYRLELGRGCVVDERGIVHP
jgi:hypothetical protein